MTLFVPHSAVALGHRHDARVVCRPGGSGYAVRAVGGLVRSGDLERRADSGASDAVTIAAGDTVTYDLATSRVAGVRIEPGATLVFADQMDVALETSANVIVEGTLRLRPQQPDSSAHRNSSLDWGPYFIHTLRFVDVDETKFVGGGMEPLASDVGLWVVGEGVLDLAGAPKTGWVRLAGSALRGEDRITLDQVPVGWRNGDTIVIAPTEHPDVGERSWAGFEVRTVAAADGATMHLDAPLAHDHPAVDDPFSGEVHTAEVLNLSRNVRIEGTGDGSASFKPSDNGRAHVFIRSAVPQSVQYAELVLLGPRGPDKRDPTHGVQGRYPLHFHHNGDASRGSLVEGVVVRQSGNRAFVPHASHGITFRDTIAYDVWEDPYWWDERTPNQSHDTVFDHTIAAVVQDDPDHRGYTLSGFVLGEGSNNSITNSVAVGVRNKGAGFHWPSGANSAEFNVWHFDHNIAHNNKPNGIFVWQNDDSCHVIENFVGFRNGRVGVNHGAYNNDYVYDNAILFENADGAIRQHAGPKVSSDCVAGDGYSQAWRGLKADGALRFDGHSQPWGRPLLLKDCVLEGVIVDSGQNPTMADFVDCVRPNGADLAPADFDLVKPVAGMTIRVQRRDGTAYRLDHLGNVTPIAAFYGAGEGGDTEPPAAPSGLTATAVSSTRIELSWTASRDDVGVTGYRIYRDGSPVAVVGGVGPRIAASRPRRRTGTRWPRSTPPATNRCGPPRQLRPPLPRVRPRSPRIRASCVARTRGTPAAGAGDADVGPGGRHLPAGGARARVERRCGGGERRRLLPRRQDPGVDALRSGSDPGGLGGGERDPDDPDDGRRQRGRFPPHAGRLGRGRDLGVDGRRHRGGRCRGGQKRRLLDRRRRRRAGDVRCHRAGPGLGQWHGEPRLGAPAARLERLGLFDPRRRDPAAADGHLPAAQRLRMPKWTGTASGTQLTGPLAARFHWTRRRDPAQAPRRSGP